MERMGKNDRNGEWKRTKAKSAHRTEEKIQRRKTTSKPPLHLHAFSVLKGYHIMIILLGAPLIHTHTHTEKAIKDVCKIWCVSFSNFVCSYSVIVQWKATAHHTNSNHWHNDGYFVVWHPFPSSPFNEIGLHTRKYDSHFTPMDPCNRLNITSTSFASAAWIQIYAVFSRGFSCVVGTGFMTSTMSLSLSLPVSSPSLFPFLPENLFVVSPQRQINTSEMRNIFHFAKRSVEKQRPRRNIKGFPSSLRVCQKAVFITAI